MSNNQVAIKEKTIVDRVQNSVNDLMTAGNLQLPEGYAASTALREAYLVLRETVDRNKKPVLQSCSQESIAAALLETVVSGFYPSRKHCYYIAYNGQLSCQRSYFGSQMLARRVNPDLAELNSELIFKGDDLDIEIIRGKKIIASHKQKFQEETSFDLLQGAYAMAISTDGEIIDTVILGKADIMKAWGQSRQYPVNKDGSLKDGSVHAKFPGEMMKRTVLNRLCKKLINTSKDNSYLTEMIRVSEERTVEAELAEEVSENANKVAIDIEPEPEAVETVSEQKEGKIQDVTPEEPEPTTEDPAQETPFDEPQADCGF